MLIIAAKFMDESASFVCDCMSLKPQPMSDVLPLGRFAPISALDAIMARNHAACFCH